LSALYSADPQRATRRRGMAYLNCPTCRLTVYSPTLSATSEECPRCRAKLGKASRLFRSAMPPRVLEATRGTKSVRERAADEAIAG
jgi:hypothetical protein